MAKRSAAQKAATKRMIAANKAGGTKRGKRGKGKRKAKRGGGHIPLPILRKRLVRLSAIIRHRTS